MVARHMETLSELADALRAAGGKTLAVGADVTVQLDVENLVRQVVQRYKRVDFLCNCAGRSTRGAVLETTPADFQQLWEINFLAAVRTTRAFAVHLLEHQGHVVQIGSLASKLAPRFLGAYPASKFALAAYAQQLRMELGPQGLHTLLVCPGPIRRVDESPRYGEQAEGLPAEARQPGGGAKLKGLNPEWLAEKILSACEARKPELVLPWKVRLLVSLGQLFPSVGDWLLLKATSKREA